MTAIHEYYRKAASQARSELPWLAALQSEAMASFESLPLPSRHVEDWKYTNVDSLLASQFKPAKPGPSLAAEPKLPALEAYRIRIVDGKTYFPETLLPEGLIVANLRQAIEQYPQLLQASFAKVLKIEHSFQALNLALFTEGLFIYLPKGLVLDKPLYLLHEQSQPDQAVYTRHLIVAEANTAFDCIEDFTGAQDCNYLSNTVTEVQLADSAKLRHYKIQREGREAYHLSHLAVKQLADSHFESHLINLGAKIARTDASIDLAAPAAKLRLNGIYLPQAGQHMDQHTAVDHAVPHCKSEQDYKGILGAKSRAVFNGKVHVAHFALHTEAKQQNKNLLLDDSAEMNTKPELSIFADEVVCTHGATVGALDKEALFYLATRGIDEASAKRFLIYAFAEHNLQALGSAELVDWVKALINQQLG